ncbi:hypothetical protein ACFQ3R_15170 [Mesonia ostreae]|uniref:Uncharacterized protein n=1 Tax=Mesonia ostreae TaxID=861110 RepID=A0ABU2KM15_9FLAO|nr:hypothetical protein [Mesonia ostreae]MDT0295753.1 hypothetical protein [Mesonia ostreae]
MVIIAEKKIVIGYNNHTVQSDKIRNSVWLESNTQILKVVEIDKYCIICNGSNFKKSIPSNVMAGGIPARIIKNINE